MRAADAVRAVAARLRGPVAAPFLWTRIALIWFAWYTLRAVPLGEPPWQAFPDSLALDGWLRWDAGWYLSIATQGYRYAGAGESNVAFFPLYPIAAWLASWPLRPFLERAQAIALGGLLISHASFFAALVGLRRLTLRRLGDAAADRAVWLACLFPFSFFMSAFYSEALFLALAIWAFVECDHGRWGRAAVLAGLAVLTRIPGLVVVAALVVEATRAHRGNLREALRRAWPLLLAPLALGGLALHHLIRFGDPLVMLRIRGAGWHKPPGLNTLVMDAWGLLFHTGEIRCSGALPCLQNPNAAHLVVGCLNLLCIAIGVWLAVVVARRLGAGLGLYALGSMAASLVNGVEGTGRVVATLFPIFIAVAAIAESRAFFRFLCVLLVPFLLLLTFYFSHWLHVT